MDIFDQHDGPVHVVALRGRLDVTTAPALKAHLVAAVLAGSRRIVIDVSNLEYVSSAGLRVIYEAGKAQAQATGKLAFACPKGMVLKVFEMVDLGNDFPIAGTLEGAKSATA